jgi:hypothetical protein
MINVTWKFFLSNFLPKILLESIDIEVSQKNCKLFSQLYVIFYFGKMLSSLVLSTGRTVKFISIRPIQVRNIQSSPQPTSAFWRWTTKSRPHWMKDPKEGVIACIIFGITGTTSAFALRPVISKLFGIEGSLKDGPNSYRLMSLLCISPVFAVMLGVLGTVGGRHPFFAKMSFKLLGRFFPKTVLHKALCKPAKIKNT